MKPDIYKVEYIGSGVLAVMAKPVSGEWIEQEFEGLASEGIKAIVSLLELHEAYEVGLQREKQLTEKNGMEFLSFPIRDRGVPDSVVEFGDFTKMLYWQIEAGKTTVIHCRAGIGRTGVVAAGVLLHCGYKPKEALMHISNKRGVQVPDTEEQEEWLARNYNAIIKRV
ncbi:MAG: tyrosine-protein phosphatase [Gammaproteobacteria bacterium]|nr:tyrosine-protein phosphatase [Gammaproteobacteria bacterium]MDH5803195.1 tyrosine-protein phosphatase [Gammaproteobacteria bacterium]